MDDDIAPQTSSVLTDKRSAPRDAVELQKLLIDQHMRCETHKTNYQTLKEEHTRLQNEHMKIQEELTCLHRTKRLAANEQEQKDEMIQALKRRLEMKNQELEVTKTQVVDPQKLEAIKGEISQELEGPIKQYMVSMDKEVEKYRTDYNKMRYQYTILKTEFDHAQQKAQREMEDHSRRLQTEISALKYERDDLMERLKEVPNTQENDLLQLKKIKTHLEQRVHVLEDELEEERKIKENKNREAAALQQTQAQDIIKIESNLKSLECEKKSIELQCERYKKEMTSSYERISTLSRDVQEATKQSAFLKGELEELEHKHKLLEHKHKMEILKMKGDFQRENETLNNQIKALETELELVKSTNEEHEKEIQRMENDTANRIQDEIRCEWEKNNMLNNEKSILEQKVQDFDRKFAEEKCFAEEKIDKLNEELKARECATTHLKQEVDQLKDKLRVEENLNSQSKREIEDLNHIRAKLVDREMEIKNLSNARKCVVDELEKTKSKFAHLRTEMEHVTTKAKDEKCQLQKLMEQNAEMALEETRTMQIRLDNMECQMKKNDDSNQKLRQQHKRVKGACLKKIRNLSHELEIKNAEKDSLEIELKAGNHGVSNEEHNRLKRKLREMERRLREFQRCLASNDANQNQTDYQSKTLLQPPMDRAASQTHMLNTSYSSVSNSEVDENLPSMTSSQLLSSYIKLHSKRPLCQDEPTERCKSSSSLERKKDTSPCTVERKRMKKLIPQHESDCNLKYKSIFKFVKVQNVSSQESCMEKESNRSDVDVQLNDLIRKISQFCAVSKDRQQQAEDKLRLFMLKEIDSNADCNFATMHTMDKPIVTSDGSGVSQTSLPEKYNTPPPEVMTSSHLQSQTYEIKPTSNANSMFDTSVESFDDSI